MTTPEHPAEPSDRKWEHSTRQDFFEYYRDESISESAFQRFKAIRRMMLEVIAREHGPDFGPLDVADVGCGAGTQCMLWSKLGHRVHGLDVNAPLIELARQRSAELDRPVQFWVGSATDLPWADESMDVCLVPELLEHVPLWREVLDEATRVLRPKGLLFLTTTNKLCPIQQEFKLPLYSWYPGKLKRYCEHLATTTHPELAGHAVYPAVNWFTFHQLKRELQGRGLDSLDKFDVIDRSHFGPIKNTLTSAILSSSLLRWIALAATPYTRIIAIKRKT